MTVGNKPIWIAKAHLNYDYFTLSTVADVYLHEMTEILGFSFNYKYKNLDVFYDQRDIDKHVALLEKNQELVGTHISLIHERMSNLLAASVRYGQDEDTSSFNAWYAVFRHFLPALGLVFGLEQFLETKLRGFLSEGQYRKLSITKETASVLELKNILILAQMDPTSPDFRIALREHLEKYAWVGNDLLNYKPFTEDIVLARITEARKDVVVRLRAIKENRKSSVKSAEKIMSLLTVEQQRFVTLYQEVLYLRTARREAIGRSAHLTYRLFASVARKCGLTREEFLRFSKEEIDYMINRGKRPNNKKRDRYWVVFVDGKLTTHFGSWGSEKEQKELVEIKGMVACSGFAQGRVKIVVDTPDIKKVEKGDILVAPYTNPNLVPAMEKAAAIVTNIGGMTSHAAIISREMNKPCIIGTKIATKVLRDGDIVEVDAENGIVRKIS